MDAFLGICGCRAAFASAGIAQYHVADLWKRRCYMEGMIL